MMQPADHGKGDDLASIDGLALTRFRASLSSARWVREDAKRSRGHDKEVDGNEVFGVVPEERTPALRRRLSPTGHVPRHGGF